MSISSRTDVLRFKEAASTYCRLLESRPADAHAWGEDLLAALADVYAGVQRLPDPDLPDDAPEIWEQFEVPLDEWKAVYALVKDLLGLQCWYWAYFDPSEPPSSEDGPDVGDLADDLADIYHDIKPGLKAWDGADERTLQAIVWEWRYGSFTWHWGLHAVSAMWALHPLVFLYGTQRKHNDDMNSAE